VSVEIIPVWKNITPEIETALVDFWIENKAIADKKQATERVKQVVCIAKDGDKIVGASTAHPRVIPRLRQPMYYYRNFIAADYRGQQLGAPFLNKSKEALQEYSKSLEKPLCLGILMELENKALAAHRNDAIWPEVGAVFIGYSPKGLHLRVIYFDDARLSAPLPVRRRQAAGAAGGRAQGPRAQQAARAQAARARAKQQS
jgi:hypothetical protein